MKRVSEMFSEEDRKRVADAIATAEKKTSAEIVTVVAGASGRYDRAEDVFGFLTALVTVAVVWVTLPVFHMDAAWGEGGGRSLWSLVAVLVAMTAGFAVGTGLASRFPVLKMPFIPVREVDENVQRAAQARFMSLRIRKTSGSSGILLYVSYLEHRVVVMPDDAIADQVPQKTWEELCGLIVSGMKSGQPVDALVKALDRAGEILGEALPQSTDDVDELSNELILLD